MNETRWKEGECSRNEHGRQDAPARACGRCERERTVKADRPRPTAAPAPADAVSRLCEATVRAGVHGRSEPAGGRPQRDGSRRLKSETGEAARQENDGGRTEQTTSKVHTWSHLAFASHHGDGSDGGNKQAAQLGPSDCWNRGRGAQRARGRPGGRGARWTGRGWPPCTTCQASAAGAATLLLPACTRTHTLVHTQSSLPRVPWRAGSGPDVPAHSPRAPASGPGGGPCWVWVPELMIPQQEPPWAWSQPTSLGSPNGRTGTKQP